MITNYIIVGLDDSAASRAAHRWAVEYARATGKDLCAVHVLDWPIGLNTSAVEVRNPLIRSEGGGSRAVLARNASRVR